MVLVSKQFAAHKLFENDMLGIGNHADSRVCHADAGSICTREVRKVGIFNTLITMYLQYLSLAAPPNHDLLSSYS